MPCARLSISKALPAYASPMVTSCAIRSPLRLFRLMTNGTGRRKTVRRRNVVNSDVTVQLHHPRWKARLKPYCKTVREAIDAALNAEKIKRADITVVLADDATMKQLNHEYRGKNKPTNILSFPGDGHLGDL